MSHTAVDRAAGVAAAGSVIGCRNGSEPPLAVILFAEVRGHSRKVSKVAAERRSLGAAEGALTADLDVVGVAAVDNLRRRAAGTCDSGSQIAERLGNLDLVASGLDLPRQHRCNEPYWDRMAAESSRPVASNRRIRLTFGIAVAELKGDALGPDVVGAEAQPRLVVDRDRLVDLELGFEDNVVEWALRTWHLPHIGQHIDGDRGTAHWRTCLVLGEVLHAGLEQQAAHSVADCEVLVRPPPWPL